MDERTRDAKTFHARIQREQDSMKKRSRRSCAAANLDLLQKREMSKVLFKSTNQSSWESRATVYQNTIELGLKFKDEVGADHEKLKDIFDKLVAHTMKGPPSIPAAPEDIKSAKRQVIELLDDTPEKSQAVPVALYRKEDSTEPEAEPSEIPAEASELTQE